MKKLSAHIAYFAFWFIYFECATAFFLIYHHSQAATLTAFEIASVFLYGAKMNASFTSYLCIFPFLLFLSRSTVVKIKLRKVLKIYTGILLVLISFVTTADLELYSAWGYRMDATPLLYLKSPREMGASISAAPVFLLVVIFLAVTIGFIWVYGRYVEPHLQKGPPKASLPNFVVAFLLLVLLSVPIRGGFQKIPINQSDVYFSDKVFANHAAINLPWNIAFSWLNRNNRQNPFQYFSSEKAASLVEKLYATGTPKIPSLLQSKKPNVIIIILESFTAKLVGCLGGVPGVTPHLDHIAAAGLLFTNIYAAGDRSEKGQIAILSGYPNQAITSIIITPTKTEKLPSITRVLREEGYQTSYSYGGELEFANIKSYLLNSGFDRLESKYSFPPSQRTTSWGVHDQFALDRFLSDVTKEQQPFFSTLFTLSSHEPYDVPMHPRFSGTDETTLFENSVAYTDSCLGDFIEKFKRDARWQNTLVVLVADHGHPLPGHDRNDLPSKFHIPLIFTGGALKLKGTVGTIGSQTDIVKTILDQLAIPSNAFTWSKDLVDSAAASFAFYSYNNGFGFVTPSGAVTVSNVSQKVMYQSGAVDSGQINYGKAYMQFSYQDFLNR